MAVKCMLIFQHKLLTLIQLGQIVVENSTTDVYARPLYMISQHQKIMPTNDEINERRHIKVVLVISIVLIAYICYDTYNNITDKEEVKNNYKFVIGGVERFNGIGAGPINYYLDYYYYVDGKKYIRSVLAYRLKKCDNNFELCRGKKFWVAYSKKIHQKA